MGQEEIINLLKTNPNGFTAREFANKSGLCRSNISRILKSLREHSEVDFIIIESRSKFCSKPTRLYFLKEEK